MTPLRERQSECPDCGWIEGDGDHGWPCAITDAINKKRAELPQRIGLCPDHAQEFYYPLADGENLRCPVCNTEMAEYIKQPLRGQPGESAEP